jgi:microcystin-dependent protein
MAGSSNFKQWNASKANQEDDGQYLVDSLRVGGAPSTAIFPSPLANKLYYQVTTFITAFCDMMSGKGYSVSDADVNNLSGVLANVVTQQDLVNLLAFVGEMRPFAGSVAPAGWILAQGQSLLRTGTYAALFAQIGTTFGSVDGTHFNAPDARGRVLVGAGTGTGLSVRALGAQGGEENHIISIAEMPSHSHSHTFDNGEPSKVSTNTGNIVSGSVPFQQGALNATVLSIGNTGGGGAHNNMPPFLVANYIIKY